MLAMRPDWSQYATDTIVTELSEQIPCAPLRRDFAKHIIAAALELHIAGCEEPLTLSLEETSTEIQWRLHEVIYVYFPDVDDAALNRAIEYSSVVSTVIIVVPRGHDEILWNACRHLTTAQSTTPKQQTETRRTHHKSSRSRSLAIKTSTKCQMPSIFPLDTYLSIRTCNTQIDRHWPRDRVILDILRRYNHRVINAACDKAILVAIPSE